MGLILIIVGFLMGLYGGINILIRAFRASILWGLGSLIIPLVALIFALMNWDECKGFLGWSLLGAILSGVGGGISGP